MKRPDHENPKYRYGSWAGNPKGRPQDKDHCVYEVMRPQGRGWSMGQCARGRGHGFGGLYCTQHARKFPAAETQDSTKQIPLTYLARLDNYGAPVLVAARIIRETKLTVVFHVEGTMVGTLYGLSRHVQQHQDGSHVLYKEYMPRQFPDVVDAIIHLETELVLHHQRGIQRLNANLIESTGKLNAIKNELRELGVMPLPKHAPGEMEPFERAEKDELAESEERFDTSL